MTKPAAKDLSSFLSDEAKRRNPSKLKEAFVHAIDPKICSLGGGLPLASLFPFDALKVDSLDTPFSDGIDADILTAKQQVHVDVDKEKGTNSQDVPLKTSLQYGHSNGDFRLREFVIEHTKLVHDIGFEDWDIIMTTGNTFGWDATIRTLSNPGDVILCEEFSFSSALETAHANGLTTVGVKMDLEGIVPEALETQLENWVGPKPKFLYTIPTGQNPTGSVVCAERRQAIYKIAQKYDFLIIEDEPYYYLQMPAYGTDKKEGTITHDEFVKSLVPSYLTYDTDGRVVRLDSFSKVLAPGTRLGWIVAQKRFIERYLRLIETSAQAPSGFSTSLVNGLLQRWGQSGYLDWLIQLREVYTGKRDATCDAIKEFLKPDSYDISPPVAGMFFWLRMDARQFKKYEELGKSRHDIEMLAYEVGIKHGVQLIPGHWFESNQPTTPPQPSLPESEDEKSALFFRGTFASAPVDRIVEAMRRWATTMDELLA